MGHTIPLFVVIAAVIGRGRAKLVMREELEPQPLKPLKEIAQSAFHQCIQRDVLPDVLLRENALNQLVVRDELVIPICSEVDAAHGHGVGEEGIEQLAGDSAGDGLCDVDDFAVDGLVDPVEQLRARAEVLVHAAGGLAAGELASQPCWPSWLG